MAIPKENEFQELISLCNKDRFPNSVEIEPTNAKESVKEILSRFMNDRKTALEEMNDLPAYHWLNVENGYSFSKGMNILFPEQITDLDNWIEKKIYEQTYHVDSRLKNIIEEPTEEDDIHYDRLKECLENLVGYDAYPVQRYERMIAHVSRCLMEYIYPPQKLDPIDFKKNISKLIVHLEAAKKLESNIEKYNDLLYPGSTNTDNNLQKKINLYTAMLDKSFFPVQRKNKQNGIRMFIVSITKKLLLETNPFTKIKYSDKEILDFNLCLLGLECFADPMTPPNVAKAIKTERNRFINSQTIHEKINK